MMKGAEDTALVYASDEICGATEPELRKDRIQGLAMMLG